jgi:hypothetical protein
MEEVVEDTNHRNFNNLNYDTEFGEETDFSKEQVSVEKKSVENNIKGKSKGSSKKKK